MDRKELDALALAYHREKPAGKLAIVATKPLVHRQDLSLAYSPGVAAACLEIAKTPESVSDLTARGNLIAVISNGTAVLGLGAIGALASKPVMEGKAVLFKKFANLDVFDLEINETDIDRFVDIVASLEPSFGGINLEDIKSPECFEIEKKLIERLNIPVFHDDQHGTAIIVAAAVKNGLHLVGKDIASARLVCSGAGAGAVACLELLMTMGAKRENMIVCDRDGVICKERREKGEKPESQYKQAFETALSARSLQEALDGADIFLGLSVGGVVTPEMIAGMNPDPLVLALANPTPEIMPEEVKAVRKDAIIATGRSDYPNQVNNVLCFPFIFRGALDVRAKAINTEMKLACVHAIADIARREVSAEVTDAYGDSHFRFGRDYIIPTPFDPRLVSEIPAAVAKAAIDSGVATKTITDFRAYTQELQSFFYRSGLVMRPVFELAKKEQKRIVYAEGEEYRVLQAIQLVVDETVAFPILIGRRAVIEDRIEKLGLRIREGRDFEICDPQDDPRYREYWMFYHEILGRRGITRGYARAAVRTRPTVIACLMLKKGEADAMVCGVVGGYHRHLAHIEDIIGHAPNIGKLAAVTMLSLSKGPVFMTDTHVCNHETPEDLVETVLLAAKEVAKFGITPKVALTSHSNFGSVRNRSTQAIAEAVQILHRQHPDLEVDGEMHADAALDPAIREALLSNSKLEGAANLLVMPNIDAANIVYNALKILCDGHVVGPILRGTALPAHLLTNSATVRGLLNISALASVDAQLLDRREQASGQKRKSARKQKPEKP